MELDRLTELPSNTLDIILARLPLKEATRTSILSRSWRFRWRSMPDLLFDVKEFHRGDSTWRSNIVSNILLQHSGDVNKFSLKMTDLHEFQGLVHDIHAWINNLAYRRVQELMLLFPRHYFRKDNHACPEDLYLLPSSLLSCRHLTKLELANCGFKPPIDSVGLEQLRFLKLHDVTVPSAALLEQFVSLCPFLQFLHLENIEGPTSLNICAPKAKFLYLYNNFGTVEKVRFDKCVLVEELALQIEFYRTDVMKYTSRLPCLNRLKFRGIHTELLLDEKSVKVPDACLSGFKKLAILDLELVQVKHEVMAASILQFSSVLPNLKWLQLNLEFYQDTQRSDNHLPLGWFYKDDRVYWPRLCRVTLHRFRGNEVYRELIRLLLVNCSSLALMELKLGYMNQKGHAEAILKEFKALPRSSSNVRFKVIDLYNRQWC